MPTQEETRQAWNALKSLYDDGVLECPAAARVQFYPDLPDIPEPFIKALNEIPDTQQRIDRITDQFDEPARDTRRIQYQDVGYHFEFTGANPPAVLFTAYEIARFIVAPDETGCVKRCDTYVRLENGDLDPLDPWALKRNFVDGFWFVRLYQGTFGPMPPYDYAVPWIQVAGYPFPELPNWFDYRFQWGRNDNEVFWLVPSNHALRLYFVPTVQTENPFTEILGRLVGFTQPIDTVAASKNVLYAW